jgi:hypothetical protein
MCRWRYVKENMGIFRDKPLAFLRMSEAVGRGGAPSLLSNYELPRDNTPRIQIRRGERSPTPLINRWTAPDTHRLADRVARAVLPFWRFRPAL